MHEQCVPGAPLIFTHAGDEANGMSAKTALQILATPLGIRLQPTGSFVPGSAMATDYEY